MLPFTACLAPGGLLRILASSCVPTILAWPFAAPAGLLLRVDLQQTEINNDDYVGVEPDAAALAAEFGNDSSGTNFWNVCSASASFVGLPGPFPLKDSSDPLGPNVATFTILAGFYCPNPVSCTGCELALEGDYWVDQSGVCWVQIEGLNPASSYRLILHGGYANSGHGMRVILDSDADGINDVDLLVGASGPEAGLVEISAIPASGILWMEWQRNGGSLQRAAVAGFQLAEVEQPVGTDGASWSKLKSKF